MSMLMSLFVLLPNGGSSIETAPYQNKEGAPGLDVQDYEEKDARDEHLTLDI